MSALDALDRHSFDRVDANNSLDTLYAKIFNQPTLKDGVKSSSPSCSINNGLVSPHAGSNNGGQENRDDQTEYVSTL